METAVLEVVDYRSLGLASVLLRSHVVCDGCGLHHIYKIILHI